MRSDHARVLVWRGERGGPLRTDVSPVHPCFFAEERGHAQLYGGRAGAVFACVIEAPRVLDLVAPRYTDPALKALLKRLEERFAEEGWKDRYSGEPRDPLSFLEAGDLYHYEGTGSGERWHAMFDIALNELGFDAVRAPDHTDYRTERYDTDGCQAPAVVWVVNQQERFRRATNGEISALGFRPLIRHDPGHGEVYEDGMVFGSVDSGLHEGVKTLTISEWSSHIPSHGNAERALRWLRDQGYGFIAANGVGTIEDGVGDVATDFWLHMAEKGLVDELIDDDGNLLDIQGLLALSRARVAEEAAARGLELVDTSAGEAPRG